MSKIENCMADLVTAIQESSEYQEFCQVRDEVAKDPEKRTSINQYRRRIFEIQNTREPLDMYAEMERLEKEYEEFRRDPQIDDFLRSELRICRILQKITKEIAGCVDLDTDEVTRGLDMRSL